MLLFDISLYYLMIVVSGQKKMGICCSMSQWAALKMQRCVNLLDCTF